MSRLILAVLSLPLLFSACEVANGLRSPGSMSGGALRRPGYDLNEESQRLRERAVARSQEQARRVGRVGRRLLDAIPGHPNVQFVVVDGDQSVNAGATFGQVAITSGMLNFARNDDELAVVLGHELAHITEGHVMKGAIGGLALNVLAIVLESRAPGAGQAAGGIGQLFLNHYTQTQERVADEVGLRYAYQAGYDPRAAVDVQERLAVEVPQSMAAGYFNSHPSSVERAVAARAGAEELLAQGDPPGRSEAVAIARADEGDFRRRRAESVREQGDLDSPENEPSNRRARHREPESAPGAAGEDCRRAAIYADMAKDARARSEKQDLYRRAIRYCPSLAAAHAGLGRVLRDQGDHQGAEQELRRARELDDRGSPE